MCKKYILLFISLFSFLLRLEGKYSLSIVAVFKNEDRFLKEWIEFHRIVGVEHFILYNHASEDNYREVLAPYIKKKIVELIDVSTIAQDIHEWNRLQCALYMDGIERLKKRSEWIAFLDSDEFLFCPKEDSLPKYLRKYPKAAAVAVNWQLFGTSNVEKIGPGELMIERLTWKAEEEYGENRHVKAIVRPKAVEKCTNPHFFHLKEGSVTVMPNHEVLFGSISPEVHVDEIRIHHYWTRDETFFREKKIPRRLGWAEKEEAAIERKERLHTLEDRSILRFKNELYRRLFL